MMIRQDAFAPALQEGRGQLVKELLNQGADTEAKDSSLHVLE
jgi:hypothetical protein